MYQGHFGPTTRRLVRAIKPRVVEFAPATTQAGPFLNALKPNTERAFYVGAAPTNWVQWSLGSIEGEWIPGEHYFSGHSPVMRFEHLTSRRRVEIYTAAAWFGDGNYSPNEAGWAWDRLGQLIGRAFKGATLLATPSTTGRELFLRSIPYDREWPILSDEHQELIRSTAGQGRIELVDGDEETLPGLFEYDGRLMYAALCNQVAAGLPLRDRIDEFAGYQRGRYLVEVTVPRDWAQRFGLLGQQVETSGGVGIWRYPHEPGAWFETWCDGSELLIAIKCGWGIRIKERLLFPIYTHKGPLDDWAMRLVGLYRNAGLGQTLVQQAIRALILHSIGGFHGSSHVVSHAVPLGAAHTIPRETVRTKRMGDWIVWGEQKTAKWGAMSHPEWSSAVWARARARLLSGPGPSGALHRYGEVVAFRTDSITLTQRQAWPDDGAVGRLRLKRFHVEPVARPRSASEFMALRDAGMTDG